MFTVYDSGSPAEMNGWFDPYFNTIEDAQAFAMRWLGEYYDQRTMGNFIVDQPYDYNGLGDTIEIRQEKDDKTLIMELKSALEATLAYIDALPVDLELPSMPGFDRDWVESLIEF